MSAGSPRLFAVEQEQLTSDDYYTPPWVFDGMDIEFDLDVCAPPGGVAWIPAKRYFTQADDGLAQDWDGRVWMNCPYSQAAKWVPRFIAHGHGIALLPHAKSGWHPEIWRAADAIVTPDRRINFVSPHTDGQVMYPLFLAAFGPECVEAASRLGLARTRAVKVDHTNEHHPLCDDNGWDHRGPCVIETELPADPDDPNWTAA